MLIELIGLPGSGKTTTTTKILNSLKNKHVIAETPLIDNVTRHPWFIRNLIKLSHILKGFIIHPTLYTTFIKKIINSNQRSLNDLIKVSFNFLFLISFYNNYRKKNNNNIYIVDEGLGQAIWSILFSSNIQESCMEKFVDQFKPYISSDLIIFLDVDTSKINERLSKRKGKGGSRLERKGMPQHNEIKKSVYILGKIQKSFYESKESFSSLIVENNSIDNIDSNIQKIEDTILSIIKHNETLNK